MCRVLAYLGNQNVSIFDLLYVLFLQLSVMA